MPLDASFIGIDQSYTGLAMAVFIPARNHYNVVMGSFPKAKAGHGVTRLLLVEKAIDAFLAGVAEESEITHICMEGYSHGASIGREMSGELGYAVKRLLFKTFDDPLCYPTIVPPTSVKKFATGSGVSAKNLMIKAVYTKWGADVDNDNAADAYTLARIAASADQATTPTQFAYERAVRNNLTWYTERP